MFIYDMETEYILVWTRICWVFGENLTACIVSDSAGPDIRNPIGNENTESSPERWALHSLRRCLQIGRQDMPVTAAGVDINIGINLKKLECLYQTVDVK